MIKTLPVAAFVAVMSLSPAYAAGECTEAHMKQMDGMIAKMTDTIIRFECSLLRSPPREQRGDLT